MIYTYLFILVPIVSAFGHLAWEKKRPISRGRVLEIWLVNFIFWGIGAKGVWGFLVNSCGFLDDWLVDLLGWDVGGAWQILLGISLLAFGVVGLLTPRYKGGFMVATVLGAVVYSVGAGFVLFFNDASWTMLIYAIVYYFVGSAFLIGLWLAYWKAVGTEVCWRCNGVKGGNR